MKASSKVRSLVPPHHQTFVFSPQLDLQNEDIRHPLGHGRGCLRSLYIFPPTPPYTTSRSISLNALLTKHSSDTLPTINGAPAWSAVRQAKNWQNNGFVGDVTSSDIRCNQLKAGNETVSVSAGSSVKVNVNPNAYHPGPFQSYLAKIPDGQDVNSWDPTSAVWFRIYAEQPKFGSQLTWLSESPSSLLFCIFLFRRLLGLICRHLETNLRPK